jgi:hypothetical protein
MRSPLFVFPSAESNGFGHSGFPGENCYPQNPPTPWGTQTFPDKTYSAFAITLRSHAEQRIPLGFSSVARGTAHRREYLKLFQEIFPQHVVASAPKSELENDSGLRRGRMMVDGVIALEKQFGINCAFGVRPVTRLDEKAAGHTAAGEGLPLGYS